MTLYKKIPTPNQLIRFSLYGCISIILPLIVLALSGTILIGWVTHSLSLIQIISSHSPMQFNTSLLFLCCTFALLALHEKNFLLCRVIAVLTGLLAFMTLLEYLLGRDLGIDTLFSTPFTTVHTSHIGRMAINTACAFIFISLSLLLFPKEHKISQQRLLLITLLVSISFALGAVSLIGYITGIEDPYSWGSATRMSATSAFCFMLIGITIISRTWVQSAKENQWLPLPIFISLITIVISISAVIYTKDIIHINLKLNNTPHISSTYWMVLSLVLLIACLVTLYMDLTIKSHEQNKALSENKELYRMIVECIEDYAIFMLTPEGKINSWNKGAERINQYTKDEILGEHFSIFYTKQDQDKNLPEKILNTTLNKGIYKGEALRVRKDGSQFWANIIIRSLYDENKKLIGLVIIDHDITKRKEQEAALRASEDSFRSAMEYAPIGMALISLDRKWIKINQSACNIVGYNESELLSKDYRAITHPEDVYNDATYITKILNKEIKSYSIEKRYSHKDGTIILALVHVSLAWNADGTPKYFIVQLLDITVQRQLEKELQAREVTLLEINKKLTESEKFQHLITESIPDIIFVKSEEGLIVDGNSSFFNIYPDHMRHNVIGKPDLDTFPPDEKKHILKKDKEAFEKGSSEAIERIHLPDGRLRTLHTHKIRFYNDLGEAFIMGIARDITEREELIQKLLESNTELERFAFVASHDLQEPIRMITNFSRIIATDYKDKLDKEGLGYLHIIEEAGARMHAIIGDLLDYSRINNESEQFIRFDGAKILASTLDNLKVLIEEKKVEITYEHLPELYGNPVQLMRVIQNLIINGIKYQALDNAPKIHIGIKEQENTWRISVKDNGLGIEKKFLKEIFEPFRRLHTWSAIKGTGIGLSICKKIIENHHGKLWATSSPKKGSSFIFTLPKHSK